MAYLIRATNVSKFRIVRKLSRSGELGGRGSDRRIDDRKMTTRVESRPERSGGRLQGMPLIPHANLHYSSVINISVRNQPGLRPDVAL